MATLNNQRVHIQDIKSYIYINICICIYIYESSIPLINYSTHFKVQNFGGRQSGLEGTKLQVQRSRSWRGVGNFGPEGMREHITSIYYCKKTIYNVYVYIYILCMYIYI